MKKLFLLSLILAVVLAAGWEVLSYYESNYTGLVLYGHLAAMDKLGELQTSAGHILTEPENKLVVMRFEGKPKAPREIDFYTAKLIDTQGGVHKLQKAVWNESTLPKTFSYSQCPRRPILPHFSIPTRPPSRSLISTSLHGCVSETWWADRH